MQLVEEVGGLRKVNVGRDQREQQLAGARRVPDDEVAQLALVEALVVGCEARLLRPRLDGILGRIRSGTDEVAAIDLEHLVPASSTMEPQRRAVRGRCKRQLDLVAVLEVGLGTLDRVDRHVWQVRDARDRVANQLLLLPQLRGVGERLPAAAAALADVRTRRLDPIRTGSQQLNDVGLAVLAPRGTDADTNVIPREGAINEDDEAV